jgi:dienelactone hydrolase
MTQGNLFYLIFLPIHSVRIKGLDAAVYFYGVPGQDFAKAEDIKCPLLCHFGSNDKSLGFSDLKTAKDL